MNALDVLEQLEATSGSNAKIEILKANKDNEEFKFLLDAALNFSRKFGIKHLDPIISSSAEAKVSITAFADLLAALQNRSVTGNAAKRWTSSLISGCNPLQQKWYSRVILKDLKCNFGISSCTKAGIEIPEFEVMLAKDGKDCKKLEQIVKEGVYLSPKFNGYRVLAVCSYGDVSLYSRNGVEYENFPSVVATLKELSKDSSFVLDGEIMSDSFNAMQQSALSSKSKKSVGDIKYHVFGWVPFDEWTTQKFVTPTKQRLDSLSTWFEANAVTIYTDGTLAEVKHKLVYSLSDVIEAEKDCMSRGFEGVMLLPNIPYFLGKKTNKLMKFKTFQSMDCKVLSIYKGEAGKAFENTMGGITVLQEDGVVECDCGSGWSVEDRDHMWNNQREFIGRVVELQFQELSPYKKMIFPTFVRFRSDKE